MADGGESAVQPPGLRCGQRPRPGRGGWLAAMDAALAKPQAADGAVAEEGGDPLQQLRFQMLQLQREGGRDAQAQDTVASEPLGLADGGQIVSHHRRPVGHETGLGEAVAAAGGRGRPRQKPPGPQGAAAAPVAVPATAFAARRHPFPPFRPPASLSRWPFGVIWAAMAKPPPPAPQAADLLAWYDRHRRRLPWRAAPGERADPYRIWLSETMLQQTRVAAVVPYFLAFVERWPTLASLAAAPRDEVMAAWAGLGYYARARRLHECARLVVQRFGGAFPRTPAALAGLPGIGAYTAGAVAAIAFGHRAAAIDGNVRRIAARLMAIDRPPAAAAPRIRRFVEALVPGDRPGDFAQALMDLGAGLCTPRRPACGLCPWRHACAAHGAGLADRLPRPADRRRRPLKHALAFWLRRGDGKVLLRARPENGLLGGMLELPSTPWRERPWGLGEARAHAPCRGSWRLLAGGVRHVFTHLEVDLRLAVLEAGAPGGEGVWHRPEDGAPLPLPAMTRKLIRHALDEGAERPGRRAGRTAGDGP